MDMPDAGEPGLDWVVWRLRPTTTMHETWRAMLGDSVLGDVEVSDADFPWLLGRFVAGKLPTELSSHRT